VSESVSDKRVVQIEIGECEKTKNTMENSISINIKTNNPLQIVQ